jgi:hypothetical protein
VKGVLAIVVVLAACGDNIAGVTIREYGVAQRDAVCRRLVRCGVMPDMVTCERTNFGPVWESPLFYQWVDDGVIRWDPELAHACIEEQAAVSCERMPLSPVPSILACSTMYRGTLTEGQPCTAHSQCIGGECWSVDRDDACWIGTCVGSEPLATVGLGDTCSGYAPCIGGFCTETNFCVPYRVEGERCGLDMWCDRGLECVNGTCARLPDTGEPCGNYCRQLSDVCGLDYTCRRAAQLGHPCEWDGDCAYYLRCAVGGEAAGTCVASNAPLSGECRGDWDCADPTAICGYVDNVARCIPPLELGAFCIRGASCASKYCDGTNHCADPASCPVPSDA